MDEHLLLKVDGSVAWLTLNRPEALNALSQPMVEGLARALERCAADDAVRAVVLTGAGDRAFCAGGDVKGMAARTGGGGRRPSALDDRIASLLSDMRATSLRLHTISKPTVAAINGYAMGAGLSLALACDLRVMAEEAQLGTAFAGVALAGDYGGTWYMTRLVGSGRTRELYFLNERVDAQRALELGLVNRVVPRAELAEATADLARRLATGPTRTLGLMKESLVVAEYADLETLVAQEARAQVLSSMTEDHREAVRAFVEKRAPIFRGR